MKKYIVIIISIIICFLLIYFLPLKRNYKTNLGFSITIPLVSKVEEIIDPIEANDENVDIIITNYQYNYSINNLTNGLVPYNDEKTTYYYNSKEDYTVIIENFNKTIKLNLIKGNKYQRIIEDEHYYNNYRFGLNNARVEENDSPLINVYENIYQYNLEVLHISYTPSGYNHNFLYNLKDIFQYKYYQIDDFLHYFDELSAINYVKKTEKDNYILYKPEKRMYSGVNYSILICNNKYIFGPKNLEYDEKLCL